MGEKMMLKKTEIFFVLMVFAFSGCMENQMAEPFDKSGDNVESLGMNQQEKIHGEDHIMNLPKEDISTGEVEALNAALDDEYKARATYEQIIKDFGEVKPFTNIIKSEENHIRELMQLYEKYDLKPIEDRWTGNIDRYESVAEACEVGVQAEIDNADVYDKLFPKVDNQDIISVFTSLRDASRLKHLPAFQRCAGRG